MIINDHSYGTLYIYSKLVTSGPLSITTLNSVTLAGDNTGATGPLNLNSGGVRFLNTNSFAGFSAINLNGDSHLLYFHLPDSVSPTLLANMRAPNGSAALINEAQNSRITLGGAINSVAGTATRFSFDSNFDTSGFNLTNTNSFTGEVDVVRGTLGIAANASLGNSSNLLLLGAVGSIASLEFLNNGIDLARPVFLGNFGTGRFAVNGTNSATISGAMTGGGLSVKDGTGTLVLSGNNSNGGGIQIVGGTLRIGASANLGVQGDLAISGGALSVSSTFALPSFLRIVLGPTNNSGLGTLDVPGGQTLTVAGPVVSAVGGAGGLIKTGAGTLLLTNPANSYSDGTTVQQGVLQISTDAFLGAATGPISIGPLGTLAYMNTTSTSRTLTSNGGSLMIAAGQTLIFDGAAVGGGFLSTGNFVLSGGATLSGVTTLPSTTINQSGPATLTNFTLGGSLTNATGQLLNWNGGLNQSSGIVTINGTTNVSDFTHNGSLNIPAGGLLNNVGSSNLVFGGGSTTFVGSVANPGGKIDLGGQQLIVRGGLLVTNAGSFGSGNGVRNGTTVADHGALVKGTGPYQAVHHSKRRTVSSGQQSRHSRKSVSSSSTAAAI